MTSKFSPHHQNNILQPKRLNSAETICKLTKGAHNRLPAGMITGPTLTLNGVTIGLPPSVQAIPSIAGTTSAKKASNTMAKRNARERNRVKQVNMGFQTLRHHIPENYRMKKMSKVDTLRCAVDYIRSMEQILEITPIPASPLTDAMLMTTDSPYHSFSSPDMNQHLDKMCSEGSSISLEQSYSSFSENDDENPQHNCSHNNRSLTSSSLHEQHALHHQFTDHQLDQEQCAPSVAIVTSSANNIPLQALVATSEGSSTPIILPLQLHSQQQLEKNGDILRSADENFNPPSSSFIRVLEIVQLQS